VLTGLVQRFAGSGEGDQGVGLDRTPREDERRIALQIHPPVERLVELLETRAVEDETERALVVVLEDVDHRAVEVWVLEGRSRDEEPALGRRAPWNHAAHSAVRDRSSLSAV
jgi:hypothetical protein